MLNIKEKYIKFIDFLKRVEFKFIRSDHAVIVLPILLIVLILLFYIPFLFSNQDLKFQIEQKISAQTKANLEINGEVKIALLPMPSITFDDAVLQNYIIGNRNYNIYVKNTKIKLSFLSSLIGKFLMKEVIFSGAIIESHGADNPPQSRSDGILEIVNNLAKNKMPNKGSFGGSLFSAKNLNFDEIKLKNLPKISIGDSKWVYYSKIGNKKEVSNINASFEFSEKKIIGLGRFSNQDIVNNFKLDIFTKSKENNSILEIFSSYSNLKIIGTFNPPNADSTRPFGSYFRGIIESEIFNLKDFYKSYVSPSGLIYAKINPATKSVKLKAGLVNNKGEVAIENIVISSNVLNGRGNINVDFSSDITLLDINLTLENIDLDAIWLSDKEVDLSAQEVAPINQEKTGEEAVAVEQKAGEKTVLLEQHNQSLDLTKDFRDYDLTLETKVSRIRYLGEEMKNIDLYATISKQGEILILPLNLELPGGGKFRVSGVLENRSYPKFVGKIDANGANLSGILHWLRIESQNLKYDSLKNYSLYSDIMLMPNSTTFNNIYLNVNDGDSEILGEMKIDYQGKSSNIISNFEIRDFNLDDYFLTSGQNIYMSPGSLLKKVLWLNNITSKNDFTLFFDKLHYKDYVFLNQVLKIRFGQGYLEIDKFKLHNDDFDLETSMSIDISSNNPRFDLVLKSENFNYNSWQKTVVENVPENEFLGNQRPRKINAFDQFLALPSLENFQGKIMINLAAAKFDDLSVKNIKIDGKLRNGAIEFSEFVCDIYDGNLTYSGAIGMKFDKSISGNISLNNTKLKPLLFDLFAMKNIDGIVNISSSFASYGNNKEDFIKNINSDTKFSAGLVEVKGLGLNDLIKKMFNLSYYWQELQNPEKILYNEDAITTIKEASGGVSVGKSGSNNFKIDIAATAMNGIVSGNFDLEKKVIDGSANIIFLTGNRQKQIPINIVANLKGPFDNILQNTNIDQALQYIQSTNRRSDIGAATPASPAPAQKLPTAEIEQNKADNPQNPEYIQKQLEEIRKIEAQNSEIINQINQK